MILIEMCDKTGRQHRTSGSLSAEDILTVSLRQVYREDWAENFGLPFGRVGKKSLLNKNEPLGLQVLFKAVKMIM
jgi:hypothetical protein